MFVRDRSRGTTIRLPLPGGAHAPPADGQAYEPSISADGSVVAFTYQVTIPAQHRTCRRGDDRGPRLVEEDRQDGDRLLDAPPQPLRRRRGASTAVYPSREPSVSGNGRYIAYTTNAPISSRTATSRRTSIATTA